MTWARDGSHPGAMALWKQKNAGLVPENQPQQLPKRSKGKRQVLEKNKQMSRSLSETGSLLFFLAHECDLFKV